MKKQLLEYLIRTCIREVLRQANEADEPTVGAAAPPADGTGAGENLPIPPEKTSPPKLKGQRTMATKGLWFVNPKEKNLISRLAIDPYKHESENMEIIVKDLQARAQDIVGQYPSMSQIAKKIIMSVIDNPDKLAFIYINEDGVIQADSSLEAAKNSSIAPETLSSTATPTRGIYFIDPQEPTGSPQRINIAPTDSDAMIEKKLYDTAATVVGRQTRPSLSASRMAKMTARSTNLVLFLYIDNDNVLQAATSMEAAKADSITPDSISGPEELPLQPEDPLSIANPLTDKPDDDDTEDEDDAWKAQQALRAVQGTGGRSDIYGPEDIDADAMAIDNIDEDLKESIKIMVKKMLK